MPQCDLMWAVVEHVVADYKNLMAVREAKRGKSYMETLEHTIREGIEATFGEQIEDLIVAVNYADRFNMKTDDIGVTIMGTVNKVRTRFTLCSEEKSMRKAFAVNKDTVGRPKKTKGVTKHKEDPHDLQPTEYEIII